MPGPETAGRAERTRERLIAAASRLAARKGFAGVTIEAVARDARVTTGAIYYNFKSKTELLLAVAERVAAGYRLEPAVEEAATWRDYLAIAGRQVAEAVRLDPDQALLDLEFALLAIRDPRVRRRLRKVREGERLQAGENMVALAARFGQTLPIAPEQFADATNIIGAGLVLYRLLYGEDAVPDELFEWLWTRLASTES